MKRKPVNQPPRRQRGAFTGWWTSDQRLLAEIRDILIDVEDQLGQLASIANAVGDLAAQQAAERRALQALAHEVAGAVRTLNREAVESDA